MIRSKLKLKLSSFFKGLSTKTSELFRKRNTKTNDPVGNQTPTSSPVSDDANLDTITTETIDMGDTAPSFEDFYLFLSSLIERLFE